MDLETKQSWEARLADMIVAGNAAELERLCAPHTMTRFDLAHRMAVLARIHALQLAARHGQVQILALVRQLGQFVDNPLRLTRSMRLELAAIAGQYGQMSVWRYLDSHHAPANQALYRAARTQACIYGQRDMVIALDRVYAADQDVLDQDTELAAARGQWHIVELANVLLFSISHYIDYPPAGRECPLRMMLVIQYNHYWHDQGSRRLSPTQEAWLLAVDCVLATNMCLDTAGIVKSYLAYTRPTK
jgi:hypothetical protein